MLRFSGLAFLAICCTAPVCAQENAAPPAGRQQPAGQEKGRDELKRQRSQPAPGAEEEIPPEEDKEIAVNEYSFNPLQAEREVRTGNFYYKKGSYRAAANRFREATKWNEQSTEAWLRLGEAEEKLKDKKAAREAYDKYLALASDAKDAEEIRKRIKKLK